MTRQPIGLRRRVQGFALVGLLFLPASVTATPANASSLIQEAQDLERSRQWERAGEVYLRILTHDSKNAIVRERLLNCMRHLHQIRRHADPVYRTKILGQSFSQALTGFSEATQKLRGHYVDRDKVGVDALFRNGIDELDMALDEPVFRRHFLEGCDPAEIQRFRTRLRAEWSGKSFRDPAETRQAVRKVAMQALESLGLEPTITVLEFTCGACNGLDEYTSYVPPGDEIGALLGQLTSLGAIVATLPDGQYLVERVVAESWAATEFREGDRIVRLGRHTETRDEPEPVLIEIDVIRRGDRIARTVRVPVSQRTVANVDLRSDGVGYLRITGFQSSTPHEVVEEVLQLRAQGMKSLVIDLRGNAGGLFISAVRVAERFLPMGVIVTAHGQRPPFNRAYESRSGMDAFDFPVVVLVDSDTASAAEVLAEALKENQRAVLVGQPTYGKGTLQCVLQLAPAGGLRLTLARLFGPRGLPIQGAGVVPHVHEPMRDRQKDVALDHARMLVMR